MKIYKLSKNMRLTDNIVNYFSKKYNIEEDFQYMGDGDNGMAFESNNIVLKLTSDSKEFNIAKNLINKDGRFAKIYEATIIDKTMCILQEKLSQPSYIEDIFYYAQSLCEPYDGFEYADTEEIKEENPEVDENVIEFIDQMYWVIQDQKNLGIQSPDIQPDNLGYNSKGELCSFDLTDKY